MERQRREEGMAGYCLAALSIQVGYSRLYFRHLLGRNFFLKFRNSPSPISEVGQNAYSGTSLLLEP